MKLQVMCVYDSKARAFLLPFYCSQVAVGVRSFVEAANTETHQMCQHPEDFTLFHLGTFDDDNATFDFLHPSVNLGLAAQYKEGRYVQSKAA